MEGASAFAAALGLVLVLELGDKTQLATISLAARHPAVPVFLGASTGLAAVTALGAAAGGILAAYLVDWLFAIQIGGGALFLLFGMRTLVRHREEPRGIGERGAFLTALLVNLAAELGDKTQIAVIVLAATTRAPISVFAGAAIALVAIAASSVLLGRGLTKVLRAEWVRIAAAVLFLAAGVLLILDAIVP